MRRLFVLAIKEVLVTLRDRGALIAMLVTPLALTLAIAAAFGNGGSGEISDIPITIINYDTGTLSQPLLEVFDYPDVAPLVEIQTFDDETAARVAVESGDLVCAIIIPENFSATMFPQLGGINDILGMDVTQLEQGKFDRNSLTPEQQLALARLFMDEKQDTQDTPLSIEIYTNPDWRISSSVIKSILSQGLEIITIQISGITASARYGELSSQGDAQAQAGPNSEDLQIDTSLSSLPVQLAVTSFSGRSFSWLDYMATSMAILFLMFAVTSGSHTLLAEQNQGTLQRLLITPNHALVILLGKMAGVMLMGLLQVLVLWGATGIIGAYWGKPLAVIVSIGVLVMCASSVGAFISAWSKSAAQAGAIGTAITLVGSALSGSFFPRSNLPFWVQQLSKVTPQAWGIEVFRKLQNGGNLEDIVPLLLGALALTLIYYTVAVFGFRRQFS